MTTRCLRILLIEDDVGDAILVQHTLEECQQKFAVHHCQSLKEALELVTESEFDLVLLDLSLPDSFGLAALDRIRPCAPDMPVVVLTGLADDELALLALDQGAQDYLVKGSADAALLERTLRYAIQRQQIQSENNRLLLEMKKLASHDPLTGVLNRHSFAEQVKRECQRARRYDNPLACIVLDIDFFKRVNDTYGHALGDLVLIEVAAEIGECSRSHDHIGRLGGEEFCVLLPETRQKDAVQWAERLRKAIDGLVICGDDNSEIRVTISLGVASLRPDMVKPEALVDQADKAMFVAKQSGRNRVICQEDLRLSEDVDYFQSWREITVNQLMSPLVCSLPSDAPVDQAIKLLRARQQDSIPVLDGDGTLVGTIDEDDIVRASLHSDVSQRSVRELMKTETVIFAPETCIREVCEFLCRTSERQVFVSDGGKALGMIRRSNLIEWLAEDFSSTDGDQTTRVNILPTTEALNELGNPPLFTS